MLLCEQNTQEYVTEEEDSRSDDAFKRRSAKRSSWGSFRRQKKLWKPGVDNPSYTGSTEQVASVDPGKPRPQVAPYSVPRVPMTVSLGYNPGESSDGVDNPTYSAETSFNDDLNISRSSRDVVYRRQRSNPYERARVMSQEQPGLAGSGALQSISEAGTVPNIAPLTPKLQNDKRISLQVKPQAFVPEVDWEFPKEKLYIRKKLGEGSFGEVWRARAEGILGRKGSPVVAVKMLKRKSDNKVSRRRLQVERERAGKLQKNTKLCRP